MNADKYSYITNAESMREYTNLHFCAWENGSLLITAEHPAIDGMLFVYYRPLAGNCGAGEVYGVAQSSAELSLSLGEDVARAHNHSLLLYTTSDAQLHLMGVLVKRGWIRGSTSKNNKTGNNITAWSKGL